MPEVRKELGPVSSQLVDIKSRGGCRVYKYSGGCFKGHHDRAAVALRVANGIPDIDFLPSHLLRD